MYITLEGLQSVFADIDNLSLSGVSAVRGTPICSRCWLTGGHSHLCPSAWLSCPGLVSGFLLPVMASCAPRSQLSSGGAQRQWPEAPSAWPQLQRVGGQTLRTSRETSEMLWWGDKEKAGAKVSEEVKGREGRFQQKADKRGREGESTSGR